MNWKHRVLSIGAVLGVLALLVALIAWWPKGTGAGRCRQ